MEQERQSDGRFAVKWSSVRAFRGIRLTDAAWKVLCEKANDLDMSRADYLEVLAADKVQWDSNETETEQREFDFEPDEVVEILKEALKANAGGAIKKKIREALELMGIEPSEED